MCLKPTTLLSVPCQCGFTHFTGNLLDVCDVSAVILAVLYGGSKLIIGSEISHGDLMSFMVTAQTIQSSMAHFSILFGQTVRGWTAGGRVFEVHVLGWHLKVSC